MRFEKRFFSIVACAIILLGLSATASATITGTGCIVLGTSGQTAPSSVAAFNTGCTAAGAGNQFTFTTPDNINMSLLSGAVQNTAAAFIASEAGTSSAGAGATVNPMSNNVAGCTNTGTCVSAWFQFAYTLGSNVNQSLTIDHDDGIVLLVNGVVEASSPAPVSSGVTTFTMTGTAGQVVNLFYDECCGLPATLNANLPGEAAPPPSVPEPTAIVLFGTAVLGMTLTRRRRRSA